MSSVIVGMSGGVDSAVTAYLLQKQGYDVIGVTLQTWDSEDGQESRCCETSDARKTANKLGIRFYVLNCISEFKEKVTAPFVDDYIHGMTPNPCTVCNRYVKWEKMLHVMKMMEADYIATGHYASVVKLDNGRYTVEKAKHAKKDQTYMLYKLTQEQLAKTLMPLGEYTKQEVREIAADAGLVVANKPDSQEICFVTNGHYSDYIEEFAHGRVPAEGNFVDEEGNVLGRHKGIIHYTVGQRKGLGLPLGYPAYINKISPETDEIVLGDEKSIYHRVVICKDTNFLSIEDLKNGESLDCYAKIRYQHGAQDARIEKMVDGNVKITFNEPVRAAAPGQSAVFYDENDRVIGGGVICGVED